MVTRDQALAWLNGSIGGGGLGPNLALLLKRQEAILARAGLAYAQGRQEERVEDESESRAGPSRWAQSIEAPGEDPWALSSDTDGTQPESIGPPDQVQRRLDDSTQEDFPLPPSSPSDDRSPSRQQTRPAIRTQTQNVTSEYSSSRRNTPAQVSTAGTEHRLLPFMLQQETQDLTDPSFSMSPRKPAQQLPTATSAGSAIASSLRMDPPPPPAMINKKGRVVKFDMPPVRMSDRSGFSAATNVTTPADTGTVAAPPDSKARSTAKTLQEELLREDISSDKSRSIDVKGKGRARDDLDDTAQEDRSTNFVMHSTPALKMHAKNHATASRPSPRRTGPYDPITLPSLTNSNSLISITTRTSSAESTGGAEGVRPHGRFPSSPSVSRFQRTTSASDVTAALRRSRMLGSEGEVLQWDGEASPPLAPSSSPPHPRSDGRDRTRARQQQVQGKRRHKVTSAPILPIAAGSEPQAGGEEETDFSEQERAILRLPLGEERIRRAKDLQARREKKRLAVMRERERENEQERKAVALAMGSHAEKGQPAGKLRLEFSTAPAIAVAATRRTKRPAPPPGPKMASSSRIIGDGAVATASSETTTVPDGGGGTTAYKKRKLALADTSLRSSAREALGKKDAPTTGIAQDRDLGARKHQELQLLRPTRAVSGVGEEREGSDSGLREPATTGRSAVLDRARVHSATAKVPGRGRGRGRGRGLGTTSMSVSATGRKRGQDGTGTSSSSTIVKHTTMALPAGGNGGSANPVSAAAAPVGAGGVKARSRLALDDSRSRT